LASGIVENKLDKLDRLYKVLLAPTTFFVLISWQFQTYFWNLAFEKPELLPLTPPATEKDLLNPLVLLVYEAGVLGISVILFILSVYARNKKGLAGRFFTFWSLFFVLILTSGSFFQAIPPFALLPLPEGTAILALIVIGSGALSGYLIWQSVR
jgi:hypothetical protein